MNEIGKGRKIFVNETCHPVYQNFPLLAFVHLREVNALWVPHIVFIGPKAPLFGVVLMVAPVMAIGASISGSIQGFTA